jgi:omega-amidase
MQDLLKIAILQSTLVWENPEQNRNNFAKKIKNIEQAVDIILLPEMFTSGFTMSPCNVAETMEGETVKWMLNIALQANAAIGGSLVIEEEGVFFNRFVFVKPNGAIEIYDKRHTFTLAGENEVYASGKDKVIIDYKGWKICPLICYDLRFPVWARNTERYDVLLYVANWPKPRITAWDTLLKARAIENMSYCIGVNRVGLDANKHEYSGHSAAYDVLGVQLFTIEGGKEQVEIVTLSKVHLTSIRGKLKFLNDSDGFTLK